MKSATANLPVNEPLRVGLLGIGTVGGGTCRVLKRNRQSIGARAGRAIELRALSTRTLARAHGVVGQEVDLIADPATLVRRPDIDVVVEAIGGCTAARRLVLDAIAHGKHVVTANKALLAMHGEDASTGGGAAREFPGPRCETRRRRFRDVWTPAPDPIEAWPRDPPARRRGAPRVRAGVDMAPSAGGAHGLPSAAGRPWK